MGIRRTKNISKWKKCEECGAIISRSDHDTHIGSDCPPSHEDTPWSYGHIYDNKLFTFVKEYQILPQDIDGYELHDRTVKISLHAMQLCDFIIGDPVIIKCTGGNSIIKKAWPVNDPFLTSILLTKNSMIELESSNGSVIVEKLPYAAHPANFISMNMVGTFYISEEQVDSLYSAVKYHLMGMTVAQKQIVAIPYYGKRALFYIKRIVCSTDHSDRFNITHQSSADLDESTMDPTIVSEWSFKTEEVVASSAIEMNDSQSEKENSYDMVMDSSNLTTTVIYSGEENPPGSQAAAINLVSKNSHPTPASNTICKSKPLSANNETTTPDVVNLALNTNTFNVPKETKFLTATRSEPTNGVYHGPRRSISFSLDRSGSVTSNIEDLTETFENLEVSTAESGENIFGIINPDTRIRIEQLSREKKSLASEFSLNNLGGVEKLVEQLNDMIEYMLLESFPNERKSCGVIIYGISGVGKTYLSKAFAYASRLSVIELSSVKAHSSPSTYIEETFRSASRDSPSIVLVDELDSFCGGRGVPDKIITAALLSCLDSIRKQPVFVLATTRVLDAIPQAFRRPGRFDYEIEIPVPSSDVRLQILRTILSSYRHSVTDLELLNLADYAHGYVGSDLALICVRASTQAVSESRKLDNGGLAYAAITEKTLRWAFTKVRPSAMREVFVEVPSVKWSDIGGQDNIKLQLQQVLEWPTKHPEAFSRLGICPPRGVLLFGPPGCSKTMIAKAVATESKLNFISIKGSELFSKWVGESEKAVQEVFRRARTVAPCIVFFDEIDAIAGERSASGGDLATSGGVHDRVLSQLLIELDGVQPLSQVTIVAATNRPDRIDSALLRPGRFDRKLYVPLPEKETRKAILHIQFAKIPVDHDVHIDELVDLTEGYSGAEIISVCHEAAMRALQDDLSSTRVTNAYFLDALDVVIPRTPKHLMLIYEKFCGIK